MPKNPAKKCEATPAPQPERAIYGFFLLSFSLISFIIYATISYLPNSVLTQLDWEYLPDKYWSIAIPALILVVILMVVPIYMSLNIGMVNDPDAISNIWDEFTLKKKNETKKGHDSNSIDPVYDIPIEMYKEPESNGTGLNDSDLFMQDFKQYRQLKSLSTNNDIISFRDETYLQKNLETAIIKKINLNLKMCEEFGYDKIIFNYGLKDLSEWTCYELTNNPGFFIIPNPFKPGHQRFLVKKCLAEYHNLPNKTNLDLHMKRNGNLWTDCLSKGNFSVFNKLRWTTIGFHYNWTDKVYNDNDFTPIPTDIEIICKLIASTISNEEYNPEAGIINYYHLNSTLSAHQDHSEKNMAAPLLSISLGSQAIFLIGKHSKSIKPDAVLLGSGDVCVMSGEARLSYHGVPKILLDQNIKEHFNYSQLTESFKLSEFYVPDTEWNMFYEYIQNNRINLNIRQVF